MKPILLNSTVYTFICDSSGLRIISSESVTAQLIAANKWYILIPESINAKQEAFKEVASN